MITESRLRFPRGKQKEFITLALARCENIEALAHYLGISPRTIRDWRREKFLMSYKAAQRISMQYDMPLPAGLVIEEAFWYVDKGAQKGGLASYAKQGGSIGDPIVRQQKWLEWWERTGKLDSHFPFHPLSFNKPEKSEKLAEFIGLMMGDGGMTNRQLTISLHHIDDLEYSKFVVSLIEELFQVKPTVYHRIEQSINVITVSRSQLIQWLHELGLPIGNKVKQNFDIPDWIKQNEAYMIACIRGLVDTDGSVFTHRYRVGDKMYGYKKLSFSSASPPLRLSVQTFLQKHGFYARATRGIDIRLESKSGVKHYMEFIGSHNPKHLKRYLS